MPGFEISVERGVPPLPSPRLAVVRFAKFAKAESEQQQVFEASVARLRSAGASIEEPELPELDRSNWDAINIILAAEGAVIFGDLVARYPDKTSDHLKKLVETGSAISAAAYLKAKALQTKLRADFTAQMTNYDAVLTLPAYGEAPEGLSYTGDAEYCAPWTLIGVPALSLPAGFGKNHLPLGLQVVGPYLNDLRTLRVAKWIESALAFSPGLPEIKVAFFPRPACGERVARQAKLVATGEGSQRSETLTPLTRFPYAAHVESDLSPASEAR